MNIPQILLSVSYADENFAHSVLAEVKKRLHSFDIPCLLVPSDFSLQEKKKWIESVAKPHDFYLHFSLHPHQKEVFVGFAQEEQARMARVLMKEISWRMDLEEGKISPFFTTGTPMSLFFSALPLLSWEVEMSCTPAEKKELILTIMGCVTDLYFSKESPIREEFRWSYRDVPSHHFAFKAIAKAKKRGIINSYKGEIFHPNGGVTRGEVLYLLDKLGLLDEKNS